MALKDCQNHFAWILMCFPHWGLTGGSIYPCGRGIAWISDLVLVRLWLHIVALCHFECLPLLLVKQFIQALPTPFLWAPLLSKHPCKHGHKHLPVMMSCGTEIQLPGTAIASQSLGKIYARRVLTSGCWHPSLRFHFHVRAPQSECAATLFQPDMTWHVACKRFGGFFLQNLGLSIGSEIWAATCQTETWCNVWLHSLKTFHCPQKREREFQRESRFRCAAQEAASMKWYILVGLYRYV